MSGVAGRPDRHCMRLAVIYDKPHTSIRAVSLHHGSIPLTWLFFLPLSCIGHPNVVYCPLDRIGM
jgi:hypothetical protein